MKYALFLSFFCLASTLLFEQSTNADPYREEWIALFNGKDLSGLDIKIADRNINDTVSYTHLTLPTILLV